MLPPAEQLQAAIRRRAAAYQEWRQTRNRAADPDTLATKLVRLLGARRAVVNIRRRLGL